MEILILILFQISMIATDMRKLVFGMQFKIRHYQILGKVKSTIIKPIKIIVLPTFKPDDGDVEEGWSFANAVVFAFTVITTIGKI